LHPYLRLIRRFARARSAHEDLYAALE
jgi:hypothetical protein